jgi:2-(1,2-epoxy-1,2-dihydrophenyl)acetyl-CoA isomerase
MSETPNLLIERIGNAAKLVLNRPEQLNAFTKEMALDLASALNRLVADGARAILVTGAGRAFCSGASLEKTASKNADIGATIDTYYMPLARTLADLPVPLVTAVNGVAAGAGAAIALSGDIILAARSSSFMLAFAKIALVPDFGATWLVARAAGRVRALEMALLGERMPAEEAKQAGLVTRLVDDDTLMQQSEQICMRLADMPTRTLGLIRQQVRAALESSFEQTLHIERDNQTICARTDDFREGAAAFREKRTPVFTGK